MLLLVVFQGSKDTAEKICETIEKQATSFLNLFSGCWAVETDKNIDFWLSNLCCYEPYSLLVTPLEGKVDGWLGMDEWEWINARKS